MKKFLITISAALILLTGSAMAEELTILKGPDESCMPTSLYNPEKPSFSFFGADLQGDNLNLTEEEKYQLYQDIQQGLTAQDSDIIISDYHITAKIVSVSDGQGNSIQVAKIPKELENMFYTCVYNNPQCGYLRTAFNVSIDLTSYQIVLIHPLYLTNYDDEKYQFNADVAFSQCVSEDMSDLEKYLAIHDYICDNTKYNADNLVLSHSPYGTLMQGKGVCQGYALLFKLLCDKAGLSCSYAVDYPNNHIWNVIEYEGNNYHIDVTWDDPVFYGDPLQRVNFTDHIYFMLSDETLDERREDDSDEWIQGTYDSYFGTCDDKSYENLDVSEEVIPFVWKNGSFWAQGIKMNEDENGYYTSKSDTYYKLNNMRLSEVSAEKFELLDELECKFWNISNKKVALTGEAGKSGTVYVAKYEGNKMVSLKQEVVTLNEDGKALINVDTGYNVIFLGEDLKPLAYKR